MADRTIVKFVERLRAPKEGQPTGYELTIDRSASGRADVFLSVLNPSGEETTIIIEDAPTVFAPLFAWLESKK